MKALLLHAVMMVAGLAGPTLASAQMIYRCGPDGRTFSQTPCANGQAMTVKPDTRNADQLATAQADAANMQRASDEMAKARQARERAARPSGATSLSAQPDSSANEKVDVTQTSRVPRRTSQKQARSKDFTAIVPGSGKRARKTHDKG